MLYPPELRVPADNTVMAERITFKQVCGSPS